ncbi:hypothetical protein PoB_007573000 [Plakobranchus ocellatus]|uniref:Uncharacterized protein n=1 Tax=Plakobranchus ocellatus TaxID=259542 RepID=A0AAV4DYF6_9GAST|nr:hypothetical protein PoB_007573000 [Plakobranchus ocellatus]
MLRRKFSKCPKVLVRSPSLPAVPSNAADNGNEAVRLAKPHESIQGEFRNFAPYCCYGPLGVLFQGE